MIRRVLAEAQSCVLCRSAIKRSTFFSLTKGQSSKMSVTPVLMIKAVYVANAALKLFSAVLQTVLLL